MNAKITFIELVDLMSEATSTSKRVCELFLRELFNTISQALIDGETVKVKGIGTFKIVDVKSRKSVDVATGDDVKIAEHKKISFTPDKSLAVAVNQPFEHFETVALDDAVTDEKLAAIDAQFEEKLDRPAQETPQAETHDDVGRVESVQDQTVASPAVVPAQAEPFESADEDIPEAPLPLDLPEMDEAAPAPLPDAAFMPEAEPAATAEPSSKPSPSIAKPLERKPMLVGIPIDGPSQPRPEAEPEEEPVKERYFYRPAPRNVYSPTQEQLEQAARRKPVKRYLWIALGVIAAGLLLWALTRGQEGSAPQEPQLAEVIADSDSILVETAQAKTPAETSTKSTTRATTEPAATHSNESTAKAASTTATTAAASTNSKVVTDVVTSQIVLVTLSEKYYGSPWFWVYIYEENKDIISDPNNIRPGTRVVIPPREKYGIDPKDKASLKKAQLRSMELLK